MPCVCIPTIDLHLNECTILKGKSNHKQQWWHFQFNDKKNMKTIPTFVYRPNDINIMVIKLNEDDAIQTKKWH